MNLAWTTSEFGPREFLRLYLLGYVEPLVCIWRFAGALLRPRKLWRRCARQKLAFLEQHGPKATLALIMSSWRGKSGRH